MSAPTDTIKFYSKKVQKLRAARVVAVQCVYSIEYEEGKAIDQKIIDLIDLYTTTNENKALTDANISHLSKLVRETASKKDALINLISPHLGEGWRFERLGKVIQSILLVGACEMFLDKEVDARIIINEYIELAKLFKHEGEAGFVNSVLHKLSEKR